MILTPRDLSMKLKWHVLVGSLLFMNFAQIEAAPCYVLVEKWGNFDPKIVQTSAVSLITQYVEPVEPAPIFGVGTNDCAYTLNVSESMQGFLVLLSGKKLNGVGNSRTPGLDGFTQAMLRAFNALNDSKIKSDICQKYAALMQEDCKPISAIVAFYNGQGLTIQDGSSVRQGEEFHVFIQPEGNLYAYVINQDTQGNFFKIFPNLEVSKQKNPLTSGQQYYFPPKDSQLIFNFDENVGEETFYFIFSATPLDDLDTLFVRLEQAESSKDKQATQPLLAHAMNSRGIALKGKTAQSTQVASSTKAPQLNQKLGDMLAGTGSFVKTVNLHHIR